MLNNSFDVIIVGAGPSGIFTAFELKKINAKKNILIIEQGKSIEKRYCPISNLKKCVKCKPFCNITTGFAGAGAFSDAKLSLYDKDIENVSVGGNLPNVIGHKETKRLIDYCDNIYLEFGGDKTISCNENDMDKIKKIKINAKEHNINLIDIPVRHLGTEKSRELYEKLETHLLNHGVAILFETCVTDLIIENTTAKGIKTSKGDFLGEKIVFAIGDGAGLTRGLMMASCSGVYLARNLF